MIQPKLNDKEVAVILAALNFWSDQCNNKYISEEQFFAAMSAINAIEMEL